jgi:putative ABC transport system permease protein
LDFLCKATRDISKLLKGMRTSQLLKQSLRYYWRTNIAVVLGVATAVAVLAGALLVGNSVRASLRDLVIQRLGQTSLVVTSNGFLREQLASDIQNDPQFVASGFTSACPLISLEGTVTHEPSNRVGSAIRVYGVDERFWKFNREEKITGPQNRSSFISPALARELGTAVGDSMLLQVEKPSAIPLESLHSRKEELGKRLRLTVGEILDADSLGEFSIQPQQGGMRAVFVPLKLLQRELEQVDKVNLILVSETPGEAVAKGDVLSQILRDRFTLVDLGIELRSITQNDQEAISLEHDSQMIPDALREIAQNTANKLGLHYSSIFSYLANNITAGNRTIPYSLVTAIDEQEFEQLRESAGSASVTTPTKPSLPPIILNEWAAGDLGVRQGNTITIAYYLWQASGRLETTTATFQLIGVVPIKGRAADPDLVPAYPGITGSANLSDWDPPFPIDLKRIRQKDEDYWHEYQTIPKAFIPLQTGQSLWQTRFGKVTSMRFWPSRERPDQSLDSFGEKIREAVDPMSMGVTVVPVRSEGLEASQGATDFGEYFLYFSFFLVISALLLTSLFFKLGIEQRVREIGLLRAIGFGPSKIRRLFLSEGAVLAAAGSVLGLIGAIAYGQLMMHGLRTWWVDAVGTTSLKLHLSPLSLALGVTGGMVAALACVAVTLRGLGKQSARGLLAGRISSPASKSVNGKRKILTSLRIAIILTLTGVLLLIASATHLIGQVGGFFGGGTLLLTASLFYQASWFRRQHKRLLSGTGFWPIARLGFRNTTYRPARSILCITLIASAAFIIVAVDSFRHRGETSVSERRSGTGGYPLLAESLVPLIKDPNSREGQQALNLIDKNPALSLDGVTLARFRVQPGADASCLNLYLPRNPKIIAPTNDFLQSNRFSFQSSLATNNEEATNPWLLLNRQFADGAVPVIADANSLSYALHLKLGEDLVIQHRDRPVRLRVVAALADSLFQSELLMSETNFIRLFPDQQGYRFFLIDLPNPDRSIAVAATLEDRLADYGFDVQPTSERLASFHRVENTYLSTFQMLGGLGLILGTIGLSAVLLRNVLERRRELALMRAIGYNSQHFTLMIIAENAVLLFGGVITGTVSALLAITPVLFSRHGNFSNLSLGLLLLAVLVSGLIASIGATWATLRAPLLTALRAE